MGPLAILLTISQKQSLSSATFSLACWTLAGALSQPLWVSVASKIGHRTTLFSLGILTSSFHFAVGLAPNPAWTFVLAGLAGGTLPPITAQARALIAKKLEGAARMSAFDIETALASSAFVIAPLVIACAIAFDPIGPLLSCALFLVTVSIFFGNVVKTPLGVAYQERRSKNSNVLKTLVQLKPTLSLVAAGTMSYAMLACIEVAAVARLGSASTTALVLSAWAAASLVTGVILGRNPGLMKTRTALLPVPAISYLTMAWFGETHVQLFVFVLVLSGIAVTPTLALITNELARVTPSEHHSQSYAWLQAGSWLGSAAATSIAGVLVSDSLSNLLTLAAALACVPVVLLWLTQRHAPTAKSQFVRPYANSET
jgi:MFS family permease